VNTYWGFHGHRRFLTDKAVTFKKAVHILFKQTKHSGFGGKPLCVEVLLNPPDKRIRDIDNNLKSLLDAMCQAGIFTDDSQVNKIIIERGKPIKGGACVVKIMEYQI
jgi:crossover junction endodeoxyribonuclease RusA